MKKSVLLIALALSSSAFAESVFRKGNDSEPSTMDPALAQGMPEMHILRDMFVGLVDEAPDASLIPGVAEKWDISADGKTYTFHLRDSQWSDGSPVTAQDFVYAWQRAVNPEIGSKYAFFLYPIVGAKEIAEGKEKDISKMGVKAIDAKTLEVKLNTSTPYFLGMLVNAVAYPVPKAVVEKYGKDWTKPAHIVSNGAFVMKDWQPQAHITLEKSPHYYDAKAVSLDKVIYYPTEDQSAALKRYRAGELDFTSDVPSESLKQIRNSELKSQLRIAPYLGVFYYGFNLTKPPFKDNPKLREALTLAIERDPIVNNITAAGEVPTTSFVVPGVDGYAPYQPAYSKLSKQERLERAKKAYAEAGYSKEKPLKVELLYNNSEANRKISIAVAAMWKEALGVETELVNKEWKVYLADRRAYNTQIFRGSWIGDYNDANTFLDLFVSGGGSNTVGLDNPEFNQLIADAAQEQDMGKRAQILQNAEKILLDNYSLIPVYDMVSKHMVKPYVSGYKENVMDHWQSKYIKVAEHQ